MFGLGWWEERFGDLMLTTVTFDLKVTYSYPKVIHRDPKVTYSYPRVTYSGPKVTYSDPKVTYRDPTHLPLPSPTSPDHNLTIS